MKHSYKENEIISSIFFPRLIAQLDEPVLIFQKGDEKFAHTQFFDTWSCVDDKKLFPVLAVLIQTYFICFLSSKQNWNKRSYAMCAVESVCVRASIILKSYISENSMCVSDSLLNRG